MLLATLARAKEQAYTTQCRSNLRQLSLALTIYAQEQGGYPAMESFVTNLYPYLLASWPVDNYDGPDGGPDGEAAGPVAGPGSHGADLGPRYAVYGCPSYVRVGGMFWGQPAGLPPYPGEWLCGSYSYNDTGMATWTQADAFGGSVPDGLDDTTGFAYYFRGSTVREAKVLVPSDMIALVEAQFEPYYRVPTGRFDLSRLIGTFGYQTLYAQLLGQPIQGPPDPMVSAYQHRHVGKWNVTFCDGHVESLAPLALWDLGKPSVARRWNRDHLPNVAPGWSP